MGSADHAAPDAAAAARLAIARRTLYQTAMFSGITRGTRQIVEKRALEGRVDFVVDLEHDLSQGLTVGASVACDGVCLTAACIEGTRVLFQVVAETLERTTLGTLEVGGCVSVERSYRVGDELGGHEVAGHIVGMGRISAMDINGGRFDLSVTVPREWMKYIFPKGFIAVDGSSLTVGTTDPDGVFELHLIPETLRLTKFTMKQVGEAVNIELDARTVAIVDTVERLLEQRLASYEMPARRE